MAQQSINSPQHVTAAHDLAVNSATVPVPTANLLGLAETVAAPSTAAVEKSVAAQLSTAVEESVVAPSSAAVETSVAAPLTAAVGLKHHILPSVCPLPSADVTLPVVADNGAQQSAKSPLHQGTGASQWGTVHANRPAVDTVHQTTAVDDVDALSVSTDSTIPEELQVPESASNGAEQITAVEGVLQHLPEDAAHSPAEAALLSLAEIALQPPAQAAVQSSTQVAMQPPPQVAVQLPAEDALQSPVQAAVQSPAQLALQSSAEVEVQPPTPSSLQSPATSSLQSTKPTTMQLPVQLAMQSPAQASVQSPAETAVQTSATTTSRNERAAEPHHAPALLALAEAALAEEEAAGDARQGE